MNCRDDVQRFGPSMIVLIIANLVPLVGVFAWGWSAFNVVALYWVENLIVGAVNIFKMLTCNPSAEEVRQIPAVREKIAELRSRASSSSSGSGAISSGGGGETISEDELEEQLAQLDKLSGKAGCANHGLKAFMIPFFAVHYGMFCMVHGVFVMVLLGPGGPFGGHGGSVDSPFDGGFDLLREVLDDGGLWFIVALTGSHLFSFFYNYLGRGEHRRTVVPFLMFAPYPRIVVLHIAILFGAFAIMFLGNSHFLLLLLIGGKIAIDLGLHLHSHRKLLTEREAAGGLATTGID